MKKIISCLCVSLVLVMTGCAASEETGTSIADSYGLDMLNETYILPDEFGTDKTAAEALASLCGDESCEYVKNPDGTVVLTYSAKTMWLNEEKDIVLNMLANPDDKSVVPDVMYMDAQKMDTRFMEAFISKSEGYDELGEELLSQWSTGKSDSYFAEIKSISESVKTDVAAEDEKFRESLATILDEPAPTSNDEFSDYYILPGSDARYLTEADLSGLDEKMLRFARNEIYAKHHRLFQTEDLNAYFSAQPWYKGNIPAESFNEGVLNDFEKKNLDLIKSVEAKMGGNSGVSADVNKIKNDYVGSWYNELAPRCGMDITTDGNNFYIEINWSGGSTVNTRWNFVATYDSTQNGLAYYNGVCCEDTYENDKCYSSIVYNDGTGLFYFSEDGAMYWKDSYPDGEECAFVRN